MEIKQLRLQKKKKKKKRNPFTFSLFLIKQTGGERKFELKVVEPRNGCSGKHSVVDDERNCTEDPPSKARNLNSIQIKKIKLRQGEGLDESLFW